ncbi:hypothetical protein OU798_05180 [Prolixibacteraceae bacterium Z1-6]|uniref:Carboxypeptidase-like regulatory domain-containing protein n=1 Tax=Draconibacterium aestuarii TaxID=2998507 RepID=A0A9X3FBV4_9BACT|nr:hypothetical protein [Prolixibacteraceae bacterium Z1-6]
MRSLITIIFVALCLFSFGQDKRYMIQAKVVDQDGDPISDVYIVNLVSHEKDISHSDGVFNIRIFPSDSIVLSHISYFRKTVTVHDILLDPVITMFSEEIGIKEVKVTPKQKSDEEYAQKNLLFLEEYKPMSYTKIKEESDPVNTIMTENNDLMRSEAASLSIVRFSPSENVEQLFAKLKRTDSSKDFYSTRKQKKQESQ